MKLGAIFDVFSKRDEEKGSFNYKAPTTLKNKIFLLCRDIFDNSQGPYIGHGYANEFWNEIHQALQYRHGKVQLFEGSYPNSKTEDAINFLLNCEDEEFLDFVEYIFKVNCLFHVHIEENEIVQQINELFMSESSGYGLTEIVKERVIEPANTFPFGDREVEKIKTVAYPMIIRKDNQVTHALVLKPALTLLAESKFKAANNEYLEALEDYKKGDYGNCLVKCGSAFESVMKIICDDKGWPYKQKDTASPLIKTIIANTGLDSYFEGPLIIVATLRNKLSKAHGAGTQPKNASQHIAQYALNATASAIILLVNEVK
ncbi:MAG: abortive infection family protein [Deltaproteobacteria bacterium]|nr:abortive infection family protein [Deltaproteobacteria bacterium]